MQDNLSIASNNTASAISKSPFSKGLPALYAVAFLSGLSLGLFNPFISTFMVSFQSLKLSIFQKLLLPLQGGFAYGFSVATFVSLYPVYLLRNHYEVAQIGYTFAVFIMGGLLATIPVTYLADRMGKDKILLASVCLVVLSIIGLSINKDFVTAQILAFFLGAGMSPIFPLSLALIGERLPLADLSSGSALFTAVYGIGCTAGPILSSIAMQFWGDSYFFSFMLAIFALFCLGLLRQNRRKIYEL
jgi:MFS family permease